jgi:hypothetical protein
MSSCGTPCPVYDVLSGDLQAAAASPLAELGELVAGLLLVVETRAQMAHPDGINKLYGEDGPYPGTTRRSVDRVAARRAR